MRRSAPSPSPTKAAVRCALALAVILAAGDLRAQEAPGDRREAVVRGVVRDAGSGAPVRGAFVNLFGEDRGVLTDERGTFALPDVPRGTQTLEVERIGYVRTRLTTRIPADTALILELAPKPVVLEGIRIVANRFERRRNATPTSVRVLDRDALLTTASANVLQLLRGRMGVYVTTACRSSTSVYCVRARGREVAPAVYIDEFPAVGGLDQLAAYQPHELYMVEVYASGRHIRAYTNWFMEYAGERRLAPIPIF